MTSLSSPIASRLRLDVEALLPALLLPIFICLLGPWWSVYQFHINEGINLSKAALVANGYHLYDQIWNDQPPVLTLILAAAHFIFPYNVAVARAIILASASLLLWSSFRIVRRSEGSLAAWAATLALGTSPLILIFSVSVMIDLPAIALAVSAIDQAMVAALEQKRSRYLLAGVLFGVSLQIKMFTALMVPSLICAVLFISNVPGRANHSRTRDVAITVGAALITFLAFAIVMREPLLAQLFVPHLMTTQRAVQYYSEYHGLIYFGRLLIGEPVLLALGTAGVIVVLSQPRNLYGCRLIPFLWLCISLITYSIHRPVFPHHLPMALIPLAWLGGSAVHIGTRWVGTVLANDLRRNSLTSSLFVILIAIGIWRAPSFRNVVIPENPIAAAMAKFKSNPSDEQWVVTDLGMDAYRAGVLVPPELAVYSSKRWISGYLPPELIISVIQDRRPSQIMFNWLPLDPKVKQFLDSSSYVRMIWSTHPHYIRSDLVPSQFGALER